MGDDEIRCLHDLVPHQEDVDIQLPRSPPFPFLPARRGLHFLHEGQKLVRRKEANPANRNVQEPPLVRFSPRLRRIDPGNPDDLYLPGEQIEAFPQPLFPLPDVAPQEEENIARRNAF